jgi:hypothetical protein
MPALPLARSLTLFVKRVIELISPTNQPYASSNCCVVQFNPDAK